jgi:hypothetical protein
MARTGITELESVQDPLQSWNWDLTLPNIPGTNLAREITIKCVSANIPGSSVEKATVDAHGISLNFAGRRRWSGTWEATFFETRNASTRQAFITWLELMRSWNNNSGSYKSTYGVTGELALYDDLPQIVKSIRIRGLFPESVGDVALDQSSGVIQYSVTFSYDYTEDL